MKGAEGGGGSGAGTTLTALEGQNLVAKVVRRRERQKLKAREKRERERREKLMRIEKEKERRRELGLSEEDVDAEGEGGPRKMAPRIVLPDDGFRWVKCREKSRNRSTLIRWGGEGKEKRKK